LPNYENLTCQKHPGGVVAREVCKNREKALAKNKQEFEILFMYYWLHDTEQRKKVRMQNRGAPVILHPWN
jgi:hypothetical protein